MDAAPPTSRPPKANAAVGEADRTRARTAGPTNGRAPAARTAGDAQAAAPKSTAALRGRVRALVEPVIASQGMDLEDVGVWRMGRRYLIRITIDADGGIGHDELSDVSQAVSAALDEDEQRSGELTPGPYTLELSSPGVDRPLTQPRHWHRNVGRLVAVRVGGRPLIGRVVATDERGVTLATDGRRLDLAFDELGPGRVQVEFGRDEQWEGADSAAGASRYSGPAKPSDQRKD